MLNIIVKGRRGNRTASLYRQYKTKAGRKSSRPNVSIGAVDADANLTNGTGFRFKKGYRFSKLSAEDLEKIANWLAKANTPPRTHAADNAQQRHPPVATMVRLLHEKIDVLLAKPYLGAAEIPSFRQMVTTAADGCSTQDEQLRRLQHATLIPSRELATSLRNIPEEQPLPEEVERELRELVADIWETPSKIAKLLLQKHPKGATSLLAATPRQAIQVGVLKGLIIQKKKEVLSSYCALWDFIQSMPPSEPMLSELAEAQFKIIEYETVRLCTQVNNVLAKRGAQGKSAQQRWRANSVRG